MITVPAWQEAESATDSRQDTMDYRREIDGLRALAVLPVILFHAGFETFSGGFVGVDVFFVISGYLITTIILAELEQGKFSIVNFYERRARRILPALFLVMLVCIPFAWLYLPSSEYKDFSQSLVAVSVFASNILFWRESGYFDTAAELKPLLHTWSLAVEEQYYVLFPLFLMLFWKLGKRWILVMLGLVFVTSLAVAQWAAYAKPAAAFYLLPTRGWELLIGAFAAFYLSKANRKDFGKGLSEAAGWLGVALILYAVFAFSKATPFPGFYALVPTIGTVLIILFATQQTTVGKFVGNKAFVGVGLISYSAYLWHQPLFAFGKHSGLASIQSSILWLSFVTLFLALLSWKFVEAPFRSKSKVSRLKVFTLAILGSLVFIGIGFFGHSKNGFPSYKTTESVQWSNITSKNFIILGDSHGGHLISGISSATTGSVTNYTSGGCIPFRNVDRYDSRFVPGECAKKINSWLDLVIKEDPEAVIILSSMGPVYLDGVPFNGKDYARVTGLGVELITDKSIKDRYKVFEIGLRKTLTELSALKNSTVVFTLDVPELGIDNGCSRVGKKLTLGKLVIEDYVEATDPSKCFVARLDYDKRVASYKKLVHHVLADFPSVLLFDPTDFFCNEKICGGFDSKFGFLYRDVDHLIDFGSRFYAEALVKSLPSLKD
jgi:peptidoglycan/LPS O-acetylase OafA/YrhL